MAKVLKNATTGKLLSIANGGLIKSTATKTWVVDSMTGSNTNTLTVSNVVKKPTRITVYVNQPANTSSVPTLVRLVLNAQTGVYAGATRRYGQNTDNSASGTYDETNQTFAIKVTSCTFGNAYTFTYELLYEL